MPLSRFSDHGSGLRFCLTRRAHPLAPGSERSTSAGRYRASTAAPPTPNSNVGPTMLLQTWAQRQRRADYVALKDQLWHWVDSGRVHGSVGDERVSDLTISRHKRILLDGAA